MFVLLAGGILNAAISLAYYMKLPYLLFFKSPTAETASLQTAGYRKSDTLIAVSILLLTVFLFLRPEVLMQVISKL